MAALEWESGTDHWAYSDVGVPKEVGQADCYANMDGLKDYAGAKGTAVYSKNQTRPILKLLK